MIRQLLHAGQRLILPGLAVLGAAYAVYYALWGQAADPAANAQPPASAPPSRIMLAGSGIVEPHGQTIAVAAPLPGVVEWVIGEDRVGRVIRQGEELLRLDRRQLEAELEVRQSQLASAEAELQRLKQMPRKEDIAPLAAKVREAEIQVKDKERLYRIAEQLRQKKAISEEEYYGKWYAVETAKARLEAAKAELLKVQAGAWSADVDVAEAAVRRASAQVQQTESELDRLVVRSPADLTLLKVDVRVQEFVGTPPGTTLMMLGDMSRLHVRVDIDEHDSEDFHPGLKAVAHLRGKLEGGMPLKYVRTEPVIIPKRALTGEQTERLDVRVLQVIYRFQNTDDQEDVFVGQQLDVYFEEPQESAKPLS